MSFLVGVVLDLAHVLLFVVPACNLAYVGARVHTLPV